MPNQPDEHHGSRPMNGAYAGRPNLAEATAGRTRTVSMLVMAGCAGRGLLLVPQCLPSISSDTLTVALHGSGDQPGSSGPREISLSSSPHAADNNGRARGEVKLMRRIESIEVDRRTRSGPRPDGLFEVLCGEGGT